MEFKNYGFIAVHIGAGSHSKSKLPEYKKVCKTACRKAMEAIKLKKTALEALSIAIKILEDCPLTNAGIGSNLNLAATVECDASIMDGQTSDFGAVGALKGIQNPIMVAKKLIEEQSNPLPGGRVPPMFLCGEGAHEWAVNHGVPEVSEKSLVSDNAMSSFKKYMKVAENDKGIIERHDKAADHDYGKPKKRLKIDDQKFKDSTYMDDNILDTVGAICLDNFGNICSGVSSGGLLLKYPGRIGQAAVYGAGCWSSNITKDNPVGVACSSSGCGEQLIKTLLCKECGELCSDRKIDRDGITIVQQLLKNKFLGSPCLASSNEKLAGIILLRCQADNSPEGAKEMTIELTWGHTTQTMAVGYMGVDDQKPTFQLTTLGENCVPGKSVLVQSIKKTKQLE